MQEGCWGLSVVAARQAQDFVIFLPRRKGSVNIYLLRAQQRRTEDSGILPRKRQLFQRIDHGIGSCTEFKIHSFVIRHKNNLIHAF